MKINIWMRACMHAKLLQSCLTLAAPWTIALKGPLSMGFSRQEYQSGLTCPPPEELPDPGIEPCLLHFLHWHASSLALVQPGNSKYFGCVMLKHISRNPLLQQGTRTKAHQMGRPKCEWGHSKTEAGRKVSSESCSVVFDSLQPHGL